MAYSGRNLKRNMPCFNNFGRNQKCNMPCFNYVGQHVKDFGCHLCISL